MNDLTLPDRSPDDVVRSHLHATLAPHLGTARERFAAAARPSPRRWPWAIGVGLAAAAAAVVVAVRPRPRPMAPPVAPSIVAPAAAEDGPLALVEQDVQWRSVDGGLVRLEDGSPVRLVKQWQLERVRYYDADRRATIEYTTPRQQTVYVGLTSY